jgi:electron transfer flavoprotein alpha subunit
MTTLLLAEHDNKTLNSATHKALSAAQQLGAPVSIIVAGFECQSVAEQAAMMQGIDKVLVADHLSFQHHLAEPVASLLFDLAKDAQFITAPATSNGKNTLPRVAALLDVMQLSEVTKIISPDTFERPIYAGNAIQTVQSLDSKKVITFRTSAFQTAAQSNSKATIQPIAQAYGQKLSSFVGMESALSDRPELTAARVIISGGRALQSAENFKTLIEPLADKLGAAMGASRAAVDAGYAPNDWQVGQTGKIVAPDLYIAVGISGAIQHLAGMKDSKIIVAINKDPDAPIFQVADYGLVADLFEALPQMTKAL